MTQTIAALLGRFLLVLSCLAAAQAASAKLDPATERRYGGVYSNACTDPTALRVRFYEDTMAVERAGKSVVANRVRVQKGARDGASTPEFQGTALGDVRGGDGLAFALHHNADGLFATIEGGAKSLAALGPGVQGQRLRHCDPNRNALPGAPVQVMQGPPDLLRDARFRSACSKALGPLFREPWLARMDGPAPPLRKLVIGGVEYTLGSVCKPHDCAEHNMVVLYSPQQGSVYALVQQRGRMQAFGNPPGATAKEMEKLWATEWQANR